MNGEELKHSYTNEELAAIDRAAAFHRCLNSNEGGYPPCAFLGPQHRRTALPLVGDEGGHDKPDGTAAVRHLWRTR